MYIFKYFPLIVMIHNLDWPVSSEFKKKNGQQLQKKVDFGRGNKDHVWFYSLVARIY